MSRLQETIATLRYRHFVRSAIDLDLDEVEPVAMVSNLLRAEKTRLRDLRQHQEMN